MLDADLAIQPLFVGFSSVLNDVSLVFAQNGDAGVAFTLTALLGGVGGATVGTVSVNGANGFGEFPGGTIAFGGFAFDAIRLSTTTQDFAVDNITVNAVPEPAPLLLLEAASPDWRRGCAVGPEERPDAFRDTSLSSSIPAGHRAWTRAVPGWPAFLFASSIIGDLAHAGRPDSCTGPHGIPRIPAHGDGGGQDRRLTIPAHQDVRMGTSVLRM